LRSTPKQPARFAIAQSAVEQQRVSSRTSIDGDAVKREEMIKRSGRTTVPQIFIDAQHIGGCDDLYAWMRVVDWIPC
jgi:glutaredoxin